MTSTMMLKSMRHLVRAMSHQFRYLIGTMYRNADEGGEWETMRILQEGDNVVVYRRQVIGNGTKLSRNKDGPIWPGM